MTKLRDNKSDLDWLLAHKQYLLGADILELGCGTGMDSRLLQEFAGNLTVTDIDADGLNTVKASLPGIDARILDIRNAFPFADASFSATLASLCLHYFPWSTTKSIVTEIKRVLKPGCVLLGRVNSVQDVNYGAQGHPELESGLFDVRGQQKRFFSEDQLRSLFIDDWQLEFIHEKTIDRWEKPKVAWEFLARKI